MRSFDWRSAFGALALLTILAARPAAATGDITGRVVDSVSGTPLAGGDVRIMRGDAVIATTTTDAFGHFVVHNL
jgi:hypothetical protein